MQLSKSNLDLIIPKIAQEFSAGNNILIHDETGSGDALAVLLAWIITREQCTLQKAMQKLSPDDNIARYIDTPTFNMLGTIGQEISTKKQIATGQNMGTPLYKKYLEEYERKPITTFKVIEVKPNPDNPTLQFGIGNQFHAKNWDFIRTGSVSGKDLRQPTMGSRMVDNAPYYTAIVNISDGIIPNYFESNTNITYKKLRVMGDIHANEDIKQSILNPVMEFMNNSLREGKNVFLHGGASRTRNWRFSKIFEPNKYVATFAVAYMMKYLGASFDNAWRICYNQNPEMYQPNQQLLENWMNGIPDGSIIPDDSTLGKQSGNTFAVVDKVKQMLKGGVSLDKAKDFIVKNKAPMGVAAILALAGYKTLKQSNEDDDYYDSGLRKSHSERSRESDSRRRLERENDKLRDKLLSRKGKRRHHDDDDSDSDSDDDTTKRSKHSKRSKRGRKKSRKKHRSRKSEDDDEEVFTKDEVDKKIKKAASKKEDKEKREKNEDRMKKLERDLEIQKVHNLERKKSKKKWYQFWRGGKRNRKRMRVTRKKRH